MDQEDIAAIADFKAKLPRERIARKLLPLIRSGMSPEDVTAILGNADATLWHYTLFYSSALSIRFEGPQIASVVSDVATETTGGAKADRNDPEVASVSAEFKSQPYSRQKQASKLIPLLRTGMPVEEAAGLLGRPDVEYWNYYLPPSPSVLLVEFDSERKVKEARIPPAP